MRGSGASMSESDKQLQTGRGTPELELAAGTAYAREQAVRASKGASDEDIMWAKEARKAAEFAAGNVSAARDIDDEYVVAGGALMREGDYRELLKGPNEFPVHPDEEREYVEGLVESFKGAAERDAIRQFPELEAVYGLRRESEEFASRTIRTAEGREEFRRMTDAVIVDGLRNGDIWEKIASRERDREVDR